MQPFGVVVVGHLGQGRYVVFGDDALFQNRFFDESNRRLAINLVNWLGTDRDLFVRRIEKAARSNCLRFLTNSHVMRVMLFSWQVEVL